MPTVSPGLPKPDRLDAFTAEIHDLVNATAPRLFAVVEEYATEDGDREARVAAWGLAHDDGRAQVAAVDGGFRMSLRNPERAAQFISMRPGSVGSLVWPQAESGTGGLLA
ncbi:hypothetical protein PV728_32595 [Streptomyces europaeiscabiei]|uniref:hypothetical protein n=1 Tax=Streptomyces TaxID=1883 RepID=UPI000A3C6272|nr:MULTISPECIES: hypothetical protein [Streptomyces]MDX3634918.1 hypothetical protein [Streptomyces europaeiscabiei]MDX3651600.1 hypothetical protein [Streptomyces europaeiscabiei]